MSVRKARLRAPAKINLDLRVMGRRPDGYHELRTLFQTISLADVLEVEHEPGRGFSIVVESEPAIEENLAERAARRLNEAAGLSGSWRVKLKKRIPMGAGLGGGSADAAAVLLGFPALGGVRVPLETLAAIAAELGSDVPFFLLGGAAVGLGRGTELYPLPDVPRRPGVIVSPGIHVSTPDAYRALGRALTAEIPSSILNNFQGLAWREDVCARGEGEGPQNDFETVVFERHPRLGEIRSRLEAEGAYPARMSGSGSSLFGFFGGTAERDGAMRRVREALGAEVRLDAVTLIGRREYRSLWLRQLQPHCERKGWPPQSRYYP